MKTKLLILSLSAMGLAAISNAQFAYAVDLTSDLHLVDLATGADTTIGATGVGSMQSISLSPAGNLFGADGSGNFYSINTTTGAATLIANTTFGNHEGMDHAGAILWVTDFAATPTAYRVNEGTGAATGPVVSDTATGVVRAMAFDPTFNTMYMVGDDPGFQTLYGMNAGGTTTLIGGLGNNSLVAAVDVDPGTGTMWALDSVGNVGTINTGTGALTLTGNSTGNDFWLDMTMTPVPEPASMTVLGLGALALLRRRRNKKA